MSTFTDNQPAEDILLDFLDKNFHTWRLFALFLRNWIDDKQEIWFIIHWWREKRGRLSELHISQHFQLRSELNRFVSKLSSEIWKLFIFISSHFFSLDCLRKFTARIAASWRFCPFLQNFDPNCKIFRAIYFKYF